MGINFLIYNKNIKAKLGLNLDCYKNISGKEHIGERNGIGKEYLLNTNIMIFKGLYKDGQKNGKGKEYFKYEKLKFEGEYFNGYKIKGKGYDGADNLLFVLNSNGKEKEYNYDGNVIFEGEYYHGKRWNGKGYDSNGSIAYELKGNSKRILL